MKNFKNIGFLVLAGILVSGASFAKVGPDAKAENTPCKDIKQKIESLKGKPVSASDAPAGNAPATPAADVR